MPLRSAWKAARCPTSGESAHDSRTSSRLAWESDGKSASHASSRPANCSCSAALGLEPTAISIASGTPSSVADGSPASPGTNVSQIASRAARALPLISSIGGASKPTPPQLISPITTFIASAG